MSDKTIHEFLRESRRKAQKKPRYDMTAEEQYDYQVRLVQKLYAKYGLELIRICRHSPEQYIVATKRNIQVGHLRVVGYSFRVDYPNPGGKLVLETQVQGNGAFRPEERAKNLVKALRVILERNKTSIHA